MLGYKKSGLQSVMAPYLCRLLLLRGDTRGREEDMLVLASPPSLLQPPLSTEAFPNTEQKTGSIKD